MVYELYKLPKGTINEKLNLTVDEVRWSEASASIKAHYNVVFKEKKSIKESEEWQVNKIWILPNPAKSGSQDYEAAEKNKDVDIFYYFISNLDKKIEFTINYKVVESDQSYYSVDVDEKMLDTVKQEKSKWDQLGFTNKDDWKKDSRKLKEKVDSNKTNESKGKEEGSPTKEKEPIDGINNKWKTMITDKFPPTVPFTELETRYKTQKDGILNDPTFLSYKTKSSNEKLEMLKSIISMYNDSEMVKCGNAIRDNYSQLYFIYWEYLFNFLKMMDEKSSQVEKDQAIYNEIVNEWKAEFLNDFGKKDLSVESLKDVKKKLDELSSGKQEAANTTSINNYWDNNFKEFGDKLDVNTLTKIKEKLDTLNNKEKPSSTDDKNKWIEDQKTITDRDNTIKKQEKELGEKNDTISELNKTIQNQKEKIQKLEAVQLQNPK